MIQHQHIFDLLHFFSFLLLKKYEYFNDVCMFFAAEPVLGGRECGDGEGKKPNKVSHKVF